MKANKTKGMLDEADIAQLILFIDKNLLVMEKAALKPRSLVSLSRSILKEYLPYMESNIIH